MATIAKRHDAFAADDTPTREAQPTYLDALTFLDEFDSPADTTGVIHASHAHTTSLWVWGCSGEPPKL